VLNIPRATLGCKPSCFGLLIQHRR